MIVITDPDNWVDIDLIPNNHFISIAINPHLKQCVLPGRSRQWTK